MEDKQMVRCQCGHLAEVHGDSGCCLAETIDDCFCRKFEPCQPVEAKPAPLCKCGHEKEYHDNYLRICKRIDEKCVPCACQKFDPVSPKLPERYEFCSPTESPLPEAKPEGIRLQGLILSTSANQSLAIRDCEVEANSQLDLIRTGGKKEIERLEQLLKDAAKKIAMQYDEYKTMRSNFEARLASMPTKEEAEIGLESMPDGIAVENCCPKCDLRLSLISKLKTIVSQTDKEQEDGR